MTNKMYQEIADGIVPVLPNGWDKVCLYAQFAEGTYEFLFYVMQNGQYTYCFDLGRDEEVLDAFDRLYDVMLPDWQEKKWSVCTILLENGGKCSIDYDYSIFPEDGMAYKQQWEEKYLQR